MIGCCTTSLLPDGLSLGMPPDLLHELYERHSEKLRSLGDHDLHVTCPILPAGARVRKRRHYGDPMPTTKHMMALASTAARAQSERPPRRTMVRSCGGTLERDRPWRPWSHPAGPSLAHLFVQAETTRRQSTCQMGPVSGRMRQLRHRLTDSCDFQGLPIDKPIACSVGR